MKVLFVYPNVTSQRTIQMGLASLSASAKKTGHICELFDITFLERKSVQTEFNRILGRFKPDLIAVSCRSNEWDCVDELLKDLNGAHPPVVVGGAHPSVVPDEVLSNSRVDIVVIGEGEGAFMDLVSSLQEGRDIKGVPNCWVRKNGAIYKNDVRPPIEDLDVLPYPDWELFDKRHIEQYQLGRFRLTGTFETSRGCLYNCTYCINGYMQNIYRGKGRYHRRKSVNRIIDEIEYFAKRCDFKIIHFIDETFLVNTERLREFSKLYKEKIGAPFTFMTRPESVTEERISLVKDAGALNVSIGIEQGDSGYRRKYLNRKMSQQEIINAFRIAKKHGLKTYSFNMVGLPYETRALVEKTIEINRIVRPDIIQVTAFFPFKGTPLYKRCLKEGFLSYNYKTPEDYYHSSVLNLPHFSKERIERLRYLLPHYVRLPKTMSWMLKVIESNGLLFRLYKKIATYFEIIKVKLNVRST